jgi:hypothetical protein
MRETLKGGLFVQVTIKLDNLLLVNELPFKKVTGFYLVASIERCFPFLREHLESSYLVDPASSHMLVSKIKPCMSKYKQICTVKLRMAH